MILNRRSLLIGGSLLLAAPAIVQASNLMPLRGKRLIIGELSATPDLVHGWFDHYILVGKRVVRCPRGPVGLYQWGDLMEKSCLRRIGHDHIGGVTISTVFLGIDLGFYPQTSRLSPVLFESMTFDKDGNDTDCRRYCTWDEAAAGHRELVARERQSQLTSFNGGRP